MKLKTSNFRVHSVGNGDTEDDSSLLVKLCVEVNICANVNVLVSVTGKEQLYTSIIHDHIIPKKNIIFEGIDVSIHTHKERSVDMIYESSYPNVKYIVETEEISCDDSMWHTYQMLLNIVVVFDRNRNKNLFKIQHIGKNENISSSV